MDLSFFDIQLFENIFHKIYGKESETLTKQYDRYKSLLQDYKNRFSDNDLHLFSAPGRTEIGGNHTDHNHGRVLAASINLDTIAAAAKTDDNKVAIYSDGYDQPFIVALDKLDVKKEEEGTTNALIRGIADRFVTTGYNIGGFNACISSDVLVGSGLSSSASVEVLICTIFNAFYNEGKIPPETMAKVGQYAENVYFGKPCGLMDQMACAVGGIITIDFKEPKNPLVKKINIDFDKHQYSLIVVNTGGNHADLTDDYASVPAEMKSVANVFDTEVLRDVFIEDFLQKIPDLRNTVGDRAVLRTLHFLDENERVTDQVAALEAGDFQKFLYLIEASGNSSFKWLQNIYTTKNIKEQGVTMALALTEKYIADIGKGACRVHGGGFAGTIQVFMPNDHLNGYKKLMESVFGDRSVLVLKVRPCGTFHINLHL